MDDSSLEGFVKKVLSDPSLQAALGKADSNDQFIKDAVALGAKNGFSFTEDDVRGMIATAKAAEDAEPAAEALGAVGCSSRTTIVDPSYSMQCGLRTQKCLCTL